MKNKLALITAGLISTSIPAHAADYGNVISSTPVTAQVAIPRQQCYDQQQSYKPQTSGGGAVIGAVLGGVLGHNVGGGIGRAVATGAGVVAGAAVGNQVEASNTAPVTTTVRNCQDATVYQTQVVAYDVLYDFEGRRYQTRMDHDPGNRIALNVTATPVEGSTIVATTTVQPPPTVVYPSPVIYAPAPVYYGYDAYYGYPAYGYSRPSVVIGASFGGGHHHGGYYRR